MSSHDSELIRLLHGELPPAEAKALSQRLEREPALLAEYRKLEWAWTHLGPDPAALPRPGFATSVMAQARGASSPAAGLEWSFAPVWAKVAAIVALLVGAVLGSGLALSGTDRPDPASDTEAMISSQLTMADSYETALQSPAGLGGDDDQGGRP
ncbi:MAG: hypothetical protein ABI609_01865 [Acidobacteriota bacterium]